MRKLISVLLFTLFVTSCNLAGGSNKYSIQGTVKNHPAKSIVLEKLNLQTITTVDSSVVDDKGHFSMEGVSEKGFYRLKLDDKTFFLFLLEPEKYEATIDLSNNQEPFAIKGPASNDEFQKAFKTLGNSQREIQQWNMMYQMYAQQGVSQDTLYYIQQQLQESANRFEALIKDSSQAAKDPLVAMLYITNAPLDKFPDANKAVVARLEKEMPQSTYTKEMKDLLKNFEEQAKQQAEMQKIAASVAVGNEAPDLELADPSGKKFKLSSLRGKVVLVDFWASWCGPCKMEMPNVVAAYKKYKDRGFDIYSVSLDRDGNAWKNSIGSLNMTWPANVSDLQFWNSPAAAKYGVNAIPAAFLLDKDGIIVATNLRGSALDAKIAELLK